MHDDIPRLMCGSAAAVYGTKKKSCLRYLLYTVSMTKKIIVSIQASIMKLKRYATVPSQLINVIKNVV